MRLSSYPTTLALFAALASYPSLAASQQIRASRKGCLLDLSNPVAQGIACGRPETVHFAVEWYGLDQQDLQSWLRVAGCTAAEARSSAAWAAELCRGSSKQGDAGDGDEEEEQEEEEGSQNQIKGHGTLHTQEEQSESGLELRRR